ncbi:unnamed protein product, partial [Mesorhabditis belari]|uniref:Dolichyl-diphosphooligosaccharide--protein glycosyltransferase subunit KCP2 n=1 Tax=Mesorhabditis belari TaxID=2138241 RepID=A0AAF3F3N7_9BILA
MPEHSRSALISVALVVGFIAAGQVFKPILSASRGGALCAGGLGALVFVYSLTAVSNYQMATQGYQAQVGLAEALICLLISVIQAALVHRVAGTITILISGALLYFVMGASQSAYGKDMKGQTTAAQNAAKKKK